MFPFIRFRFIFGLVCLLVIFATWRVQSAYGEKGC